MNLDFLPCPADHVGSYVFHDEDAIGSPVTEDERYDDLEELCSSMRSKPWQKVLCDSGALLTEVGKDLKVLSFYSQALFQLHGIAGLSAAYQCWIDALGPLWESIYPRSPRRRLAAVRNFVSITSPWIKQRPPEEKDAEIILTCVKRAGLFEERLIERFEGEAPPYDEVLQLLKWCADEYGVDPEKKKLEEEKHRQAEEEKRRLAAEERLRYEEERRRQEEEAERRKTEDATLRREQNREERRLQEEQRGQVKENATPEVSGTLDSSSQHSVETQCVPVIPEVSIKAPPIDQMGREQLYDAFSQVRKEIWKLVEAARTVDIGNPVWYRLERDWAWCLLDAPALDPMNMSRVRVPAPYGGVSETLDQLAQGQKWRELLTAAESAWRGNMFWLDPHRHVANALRNLKFPQAESAVRQAVAEFLVRVPELLSLSFAEGTALANESTRSWLKATSTLGSAESTRSSTLPSSFPVAPLPMLTDVADEDVFTRCATLLADGKAIEAAQTMEASLCRQTSRRDRFRHKVRFSNLLIDHGLYATARPLLISLSKDVDQYHLEEWEPALVSSVVRGLLMSHLNDSEGSTSLPVVEDLRLRSARLGALTLLI